MLVSRCDSLTYLDSTQRVISIGPRCILADSGRLSNIRLKKRSSEIQEEGSFQARDRSRKSKTVELVLSLYERRIRRNSEKRSRIESRVTSIGSEDQVEDQVKIKKI